MIRAFIWLVIIFITSVCSAENIEWIERQEGIKQVSLEVAFDSEKYKVSIVQIDMKYHNVEIIGMYDYFSQLNGADDLGEARIEAINGKKVLIYNEFNLQDYISVNKQPSFVSSLGYSLINGEPTPLGLFRIKNKVLSKFSDSSKFLSAILCQIDLTKPNHSVTAMYTVDDYRKKNRCNGAAIQVGPRIIEKVTLKGIAKLRKDQSDDRVVFSLGLDDNVYLLFWEKTPLFIVQELMLPGIAGEGSIPRYAINISIREMAGMLLNDKKSNNEIGNTESKIPALLVFTKREKNNLE